MSGNHRNRSRARGPGRNPKPREIVELREEMGLSQTEFGALVYRNIRAVQDWEGGQRQMPPALWEYICLLHGFPAVARAREEWLASLRSKREVVIV
jgi:DNA-binding transcriptional regulator YiaG